MKLTSIAYKNLKQNFSFYSLYLFSVSFVLMIFFCFISFSLNQIIMEKISSDGRVETMCRTVAVFVMAFVIFYMAYSNRFFMRRRMRELGIYALLGYRKKSILALLTLEDMTIGAGGLFVGILGGSLLHKAVTGGIISLLGLSVSTADIPLINMEAVKFSAWFVLAVLLALAFSNAKLLWKSTLLELVCLEKKEEKQVKVKAIFAISSAALLFLGYALALDIRRGGTSFWQTVGFSPVALLTLALVTVGTVLFIYSFLPYTGQLIKKNRAYLYRENTIIVVPKFMHRIRSNAKSLILLTLLSAGTLAVLGSTVLSVWYPIQALDRIIPSAMEYRVTDEEESKKALKALDETAKKSETYETHILKVTADSRELPLEYDISAKKGRVPGFECISETDYRFLMSLQNRQNTLPSLDDRECVLVKYRPDSQKADVGSRYNLHTGDGEGFPVTVKDTTLVNPIGFGNSVGTLIVTDSVYQTIKNGNPEEIPVMSIGGKDLRSHKQAYQAVKDIMEDNIYFVSAYQRQEDLIHQNSSTLLLICFATVIFLIATGSILYFQNISSAAYDKADYEIMGKMGYDMAGLKRIIRRQVQICFLVPYIMGTMHSIFALICYKSALMDDLLGRTSAVVVPVLFSVGVFTAIYLVYYLVTKRSCYLAAGLLPCTPEERSVK